MADFLTVLATAFGVIFVAELGDKTQLLALSFGTRHSLRTVVIGLTLGYAAAGAIATIVGGMLGAALPDRPIEIVGGVVFLMFAVFAALNADNGAADGAGAGAGDGAGAGAGAGDGAGVGSSGVPKLLARSVAVSIGFTIAVAEMGDKTQIATATLAARSDPLATWIGATAGAVCSGMIGALAGRALGERIDPSVLRWVSAGLFATFGVLMLVGLF